MTTALANSGQLLADHYHGPGPWWPIFPIMWFLFILTFVFVITRFGWWRGRRQCDDLRNEPTRTGKARLAERFAAGEIDEQEYRSRIAVLDGTSGDPGELR
jgi:putative membrane protein